MKKMKLVSYFMLAFLLSAINLYGQNQLFVNTGRSAKEAFDLKEVKKITFATGKFMVVNEVQKQEYSLSDTPYLSFRIFPFSSLDSNETRDNLNVFPNPVTDEITVESDALVLRLVLYDLGGKPVKQAYFSTSTARWEIADVPSGTYLLQIVTSQSSVSKKIIKK